ncbi:hypothetical protein L1887_55081 [Cichorium endivia]|nr:hypothetical protein L1887_55081 [Cichorium endivia]
MRLKKKSNSCALVRASDETPLISTVYRFGPGRHPRMRILDSQSKVSVEEAINDDNVTGEQVEVRSRSIISRAQTFDMSFGKFEWRYGKRKERAAFRRQQHPHLGAHRQRRTPWQRWKHTATPSPHQAAIGCKYCTRKQPRRFRLARSEIARKESHDVGADASWWCSGRCILSEADGWRLVDVLVFDGARLCPLNELVELRSIGLDPRLLLLVHLCGVIFGRVLCAFPSGQLPPQLLCGSPCLVRVEVGVPEVDPLAMSLHQPFSISRSWQTGVVEQLAQFAFGSVDCTAAARVSFRCSRDRPWWMRG